MHNTGAVFSRNKITSNDPEGIICIFIFCSRAAYFNPMYFLFGYQFYYAVTTKNVKILIITRQHLKNPEMVQFDRIKRINDFTFIDIEGRE